MSHASLTNLVIKQVYRLYIIEDKVVLTGLIYLATYKKFKYRKQRIPLFFLMNTGFIADSDHTSP